MSHILCVVKYISPVVIHQIVRLKNAMGLVKARLECFHCMHRCSCFTTQNWNFVTNSKHTATKKVPLIFTCMYCPFFVVAGGYKVSVQHREARAPILVCRHRRRKTTIPKQCSVIPSQCSFPRFFGRSLSQSLYLCNAICCLCSARRRVSFFCML